MDLKASRDRQFADLGLGDLPGVGTQGYMNFVGPLHVLSQYLKQPLGV